MIFRCILLLIRVVLGLTFLWAGLIKAGASQEFAIGLMPFTFVPDAWVDPLAWTLPWVEVAGGILILLPWTKKVGAGILLLLCVIFIIALTWALKEDIIIACSCFGKEDEVPSAFKMQMVIVRDVIMAAAASLVIWKG
jgi:uncharacterized membrane protein YphA (DoxX/SURF4 family)